jgi:hypothetical protein
MWHRGVVVCGHGVASGSAAESPYPAGTIALQTPAFLAQGLDLSNYHPGTINLDFPGCRWELSEPDHRFPSLHWTDLHPPETFSFWRVALRRHPADPAVAGLIYYPHPETKARHFQSPSRLELLAPYLDALRPGDGLELEVDPNRLHLVPVARLRARLLEFLKFRVLAAQETFFSGDLADCRTWLAEQWPEAAPLSDAEVQSTLDQARALYTESRLLG